MGAFRFENTRLVLAEPKSKLRHRLKEDLFKLGFHNILDTGNMLDVRNAVLDGEVDILVADTSLPEGDINEMIHSIRHGRIGENPFIVTITLVTEPVPDLIKDVAGSGTDAVGVKPFTADQLSERIRVLVHNRKRFVVTTDYIGPDRRQVVRHGTRQFSTVRVPNPLLNFGNGQQASIRTRRFVESVNAKINEKKVECHAHHIDFLAKLIREKCRFEASCAEAHGDLERLSKVARDIARRIKRTRYANITDLCLTLSNLTDSLWKHSDGVDRGDLAMLYKLAQVIRRSFEVDKPVVSESRARTDSRMGGLIAETP